MKEFLKKGVTLLLLPAILFAGVSLIWYLTAYRAYDVYVEKLSSHYAVSRIDAFGIYAEDGEGYSYYIKRPGFLSWTGNLNVSVPTFLLDNGEEMLFVDGLLVWPEGDGYEFGVELFEYEESENGISAVSYCIYIDEEGNYIPWGDDSDAQNREVLNRHEESVTEMLERFFSVWPEK